MPKVSKRRSSESIINHRQTSIGGNTRKVSFEDDGHGPLHCSASLISPINSCSSGSLPRTNGSRNLKPKVFMREATPVVSLTELATHDDIPQSKLASPLPTAPDSEVGCSPWGYFVDVISPSSHEMESIPNDAYRRSRSSNFPHSYQPYKKPRQINCRKTKGFLPGFFLSIPSADEVEGAMKRMHV